MALANICVQSGEPVPDCVLWWAVPSMSGTCGQQIAPECAPPSGPRMRKGFPPRSRAGPFLLQFYSIGA
eukprot:3074851-Amphidinium_carterae.1